MMKGKEIIKNYKFIGSILYLIGITLLVLHEIGPKVFSYNFISGFGTGLLIVAIGLTVIYFIKHKDEDFESDLEASFQDERVLLERAKINAYIMKGMIVVITIMVTVSVFYDFSFMIGGAMLLWFYILAYGAITMYRWFRKDK